MTKEEKTFILKQVFSPTSPIKQKDFFYGRINQLNKVADAINEEGQHAILYGDRGVGKTSLANIMATSYTNLYPIKVTCNRQDNFRTLWENALDSVQFSRKTDGIGFNPQQAEEIVRIGNQLRGIKNVRPNHIVQILNSLPAGKLLFIFDEFDNISTQKARSSFADLIKSMSDNNTNSTIVLVGISDSIENLIGNHQSLERCLKQVKMPKMKDEECEEIIVNGLNRLEIGIDDKVKEKIIEFSSGFPHYVHLLCKYGAKEIIENEKRIFSEAYLGIAIRLGIENTSEQLRISYRKAILTSNSSSKWRDLLFACAIVKIDEFNAFTISDVVKIYNKISGRNVKNNSITYNLNQLVTENRGEVLVKLGKGMSTRYMFKNPMMRAFVKLKINAE
ncbi:ATP-binding protein [Muricauda sp. NFXS6]|uniref:ATP-binding protein n=1 Tax=Allomuricauda sp. NFXS6 TaxID=2819094 RepID=UPI0032DFED5C